MKNEAIKKNPSSPLGQIVAIIAVVVVAVAAAVTILIETCRISHPNYYYYLV